MNPTQQLPRPALNTVVDQVDAVDGDELVLTPADVLTGAALYIERHGLHQGEMFTDPTALTPPACLQGAIRMAACGGTAIDYTPGTAALVEECIELLAEYLCGLDYPVVHTAPGDCVADWNDTPGRTADHVIAALRAVARQWEHTFDGIR